MIIDLKDLKENFNLEAAFNLGESKESVGELESDKEVLGYLTARTALAFETGGREFESLWAH